MVVINYKENIEYRASLIKKTLTGGKITKEERNWCLENPAFNESYEEEYLMVDVLKLQPNCSHEIRITVEKYSPQRHEIIPVLGVAERKGVIETTSGLLDLNGNEVPQQQTKYLGMLINPDNPQVCVRFKGEKGLLSVAYQCDYYDERENLYKRQSSSGANLAFAMQKTVISETKVRYSCKSPLGKTFDALIFTVEWN